MTMCFVKCESVKSLFVCWLFAGDFKCPIKEEIAITSGEWEVLGRHGSNVSLRSRCVDILHAMGRWYLGPHKSVHVVLVRLCSLRRADPATAWY